LGNLKIRSFIDEHINSAGNLVANTVKRLRNQGAVLSHAYENEELCIQFLIDLFQKGAIGAAAIENGKLSGFIIGLPREDEFFGRSVWSKVPMHALAEGVEPALYRHLYAAAGEQWMANGYPNHYVEEPAIEKTALWTWFGLGFGQQQVYGALDLAAHSHSEFTNDGKITIRRAAAGDEEILKSFAWNVAGYQMGAPVWAPTAENEKAELEEGYSELATDPDSITWLAFDGDSPVGMQRYHAVVDASKDILNVEGGIELAPGSTMPQARGKGSATLMTQHGLAYAREHGFKTCLIDWRTTNLLSAAFWPKMGFEPVVFRLERRVDFR
jgi:GNAT superfamily N-acetyltransferase